MLFRGRSRSTPRRLCSLAPRTTRRSATEVPSTMLLLTGHTAGQAVPTDLIRVADAMLGRGTDNFRAGRPERSATGQVGAAHLGWRNQVWCKAHSELPTRGDGRYDWIQHLTGSVRRADNVPEQRRANERSAAAEAQALPARVRAGDRETRPGRRGARRAPDPPAERTARLVAAHVVTHLARNADGWSTSSPGHAPASSTRCTPSNADRDADIEEGATRLAQVLHEDLRAASDRFVVAGERLPDPRGRRRSPGGPPTRLPGGEDPVDAAVRAVGAPGRPRRRRPRSPTFRPLSSSRPPASPARGVAAAVDRPDREPCGAPRRSTLPARRRSAVWDLVAAGRDDEVRARRSVRAQRRRCSHG